MTTVLNITQRINAAPDLYGLQPVTTEMVQQAIESLKADGYSHEYLANREELIARRILRLDPGKLAL